MREKHTGVIVTKPPDCGTKGALISFVLRISCFFFLFFQNYLVFILWPSRFTINVGPPVETSKHITFICFAWVTQMT